MTHERTIKHILTNNYEMVHFSLWFFIDQGENQLTKGMAKNLLQQSRLKKLA
jgi:hypothetical protein